MKIYSIKDTKMGFMNPFVMNNDDLAIRYFKNSVESPAPTLISMNPEDFELWCIGSFDQDTGVISSNVSFVVNAISFKK